MCSLHHIYSLFQFTTSQGGRLEGREQDDNLFDLSIHDLTRRSTSMSGTLENPLLFQFTTSQGGRLSRQTSNLADAIFQFTTSQGGRPLFSIFSAILCDLSIHDLTRRSTITIRILERMTVSFNSRPHKEVDL